MKIVEKYSKKRKAINTTRPNQYNVIVDSIIDFTPSNSKISKNSKTQLIVMFS